jgi:hypothetical protein
MHNLQNVSRHVATPPRSWYVCFGNSLALNRKLDIDLAAGDRKWNTNCACGGDFSLVPCPYCKLYFSKALQDVVSASTLGWMEVNNNEIMKDSWVIFSIIYCL